MLVMQQCASAEYSDLIEKKNIIGRITEIGIKKIGGNGDGPDSKL